MRIMTKTEYDAICDIVMEQKKRIEEKDNEISKLKRQLDFLESLIKAGVNVTIHEENDIDFPNSDHKTYNGYVDKFI